MKKRFKIIVIGFVVAIIFLSPFQKLLIHLIPSLSDNVMAITLVEIGCVLFAYAIYKAVSLLIKKRKGIDEVEKEKNREKNNGEFYSERFELPDLIKGIVLYLVTWLSLNISFLDLFHIENAFLLANEYFVIYFFLFVLFFIVYGKMIVTMFRNFFSDKEKKQRIESAFIAAGIVLFVMIISAVLIDKLNVSNSNEEGLEEWTRNSVIPSVLTCVLFAPVTEELNYRFFWFRLLEKINKIFAHIVVGVMFGTIHVSVAFFMTGDWRVLLNAVPYVAMSLGLSITYEKNRSLIYPIMIHMLINFIATSGTLF